MAHFRSCIFLISLKCSLTTVNIKSVIWVVGNDARPLACKIKKTPLSIYEKNKIKMRAYRCIAPTNCISSIGNQTIRTVCIYIPPIIPIVPIHAL